jgi:DNA-binding CsgD family transcriptional regulator
MLWEQADSASGGVYSGHLNAIARRYPQLSSIELHVAALVKAMLPSWQIAQLLGITEKTVENHRIDIRRKIGCDGNLVSFLQKLNEQ